MCRYLTPKFPGARCLLPVLFHLIPSPCDVESGDLSKTELIAEQCCQPCSALRALGCSFMAADTVQAGKALKMQKG